jgi:hypothetical protein
MNINEYLDIAKRIESLVRRSDTFGKDKEDILEELLFIANDLRSQANRMDEQFEKEFYNDSRLSLR